MKKGAKISISILFTILVASFGYKIYLSISEYCYESKYGLSLNDMRREHCIPIIDDEWKIIDYSRHAVRWGHNELPSIKKPFHFRKEAILSNGNIVKEEDSYHFNCSDSVEYRLIIWNEYFNKKERNYELLTYRLSKVSIGENEFEGADVTSDSLDHKELKNLLFQWELDSLPFDCR